MNPDAFRRFIGPKNLGKALIDDELVSCLMDNGAQLNFITPAYAQERGMDIMSLDFLAEEIGGSIPLIRSLGGISVEPVGFIMMNVKVLVPQICQMLSVTGPVGWHFYKVV